MGAQPVFDAMSQCVLYVGYSLHPVKLHTMWPRSADNRLCQQAAPWPMGSIQMVTNLTNIFVYCIIHRTFRFYFVSVACNHRHTFINGSTEGQPSWVGLDVWLYGEKTIANLDTNRARCRTTLLIYSIRHIEGYKMSCNKYRLRMHAVSSMVD